MFASGQTRLAFIPLVVAMVGVLVRTASRLLRRHGGGRQLGDMG
jgi:hypothetical protein